MGLFDEVETFFGMAPAPPGPALAPDVAPPVVTRQDQAATASLPDVIADTTATIAHAFQASAALYGGWTTLNIQQDLNKLGASPPLAEDGKPGSLTTAALKRYQTSRGLKADGELGPATEAQIVSDLGGMSQVYVAPGAVSAPTAAPAAPAAPAIDPLLGGKAPPAAAVKKPVSKALLYGGGAGVIGFVGLLASLKGHR